MKIKDVQEKILRLKEENDICIAAHCYQAREIIEIADFTGDSFQLSTLASKATQKTIIMCGVRFMAETVKLLSPEKSVYLVNPEAGCPMAENISKAEVLEAKSKYPGHTVVAYVNTTAEVKASCDVCVTSSSGEKIIKNIQNDKILFLPDPNLGAYLQSKAPEKSFVLLKGGCPVHDSVTVEDVINAKSKHPEALVLIHPECVPDVIKLADYVGSTTGIMDFAMKSDKKEFLIGTEMAIVENLEYMCPDKRFYSLSNKLICPDMKFTTLHDVLHCVRGTGGEEIIIDEETLLAAKKSIVKMMELG